MSYKELAPDEVIVTQAKNSEIQNILSCELEAAEAYREVISTLSPDAQTWKLELLMHDHKNAVSYWKTQVTVIPKHKRQGNTAWSKVINTLLSKTSLERIKCLSASISLSTRPRASGSIFPEAFFGNAL